MIFAGISSHVESIVLQTAKGYFLRMPIGEIPFQKRNTLGVRGIRLAERDALEHAYLLESTLEYAIPYKERNLLLNRLKLAGRDTKGRKV